MSDNRLKTWVRFHVPRLPHFDCPIGRCCNQYIELIFIDFSIYNLSYFALMSIRRLDLHKFRVLTFSKDGLLLDVFRLVVEKFSVAESQEQYLIVHGIFVSAHNNVVATLFIRLSSQLYFIVEKFSLQNKVYHLSEVIFFSKK